VVKPIAAKNGLDIEIVEFTDYVVPNAALDAGDLQTNSFQNQQVSNFILTKFKGAVLPTW
jgi:ABC-type metal ion transport system substrate-binding protein